MEDQKGEKIASKLVIGEHPACTNAFMSVVHLIHYTYMCCVCLSAGAGLPGAFLSVSG